MDALQDRVIFIDAEAIVLDKPAGLAVHPGPATYRSLEDHLDELRFGFRRPPSPVHRLDRDTSGCLLLARNAKVHKRFARAFEEGMAEKIYVAVLDGVPEAPSGRIEQPLIKVSSREEGWRMVCDPAGKPAVTDWERVAVRGGQSLVLFRPRTGRTHQIRIHAAEGLGLPIVGDPVYAIPPRQGVGDRPKPQAKEGRGDFRPMLLHALSLSVPRERKPPVEARAPLPPPFLEAGFDDAGL